MAWYHRLLNVIRPERTSRELDDELSFHIAERIDELVDSGMSEEDARLLARRQFGNYQSRKEQTRDMDTVNWLECLGKDVRFALRSFRRKPLFLIASVLTLAIGIGATTTIYSVVDTVVLRPLPYPEANRLVYFQNASHSFPQWRSWQKLDAFEVIGGVQRDQVDLTGIPTPERLPAARVSADFFRLMGATAFQGRLFDPDDYPDNESIAIVSYGTWERIWGKDPKLLGSSVRLNGKLVEIIGILNPGFRPPDIVTGNKVDLWFPLGTGGAFTNDHGVHILEVAGRIRRDVSIQAAQTQVDATQAAFAREAPDDYRARNGGILSVPLALMQQATAQRVSQTLWILLGAVGFMHLIACTNVANLFLARGISRSREIALRAALGASRMRITAQVLTESIVVALLGGVAGSILAYAGVTAFVHFNPGGIPRLEGITVDVRVLLFAVVLSVVTGVVFGWLPAVHATRRDVNDALKGGSASVTTSRNGMRVRSLLVVTETALAVILLIGAGLLFRTLMTMMQVDPGFKSDKLVIVPLSLDAGYKDADRRRFVEELLPRIEALPGVRSVSAARALPFSYTGPGWSGRRSDIVADSVAENGPEPFGSMIHMTTKGFFATLGVPVIYGRDFSAVDMSGTSDTAIINRQTAKRLFGEENVIGRRFKIGVQRPKADVVTVVGVVDGVHQWGATRAVEDDVYVPYPQFGTSQPRLELAIRTDASLGSIAEPVRKMIWSIDPNLPLSPALTMDDRISNSMATPRFLSGLFMVFSGVALLLACGGILSSLLYTVSERRRELGVRLALGAQNSDLLVLVLRYGAVLSVTGIVVGIAAGLSLSNLIKGMLWNVAPTDPTTFVGVALIIGVMGVIASLLPAWNASRTDPLKTLRSE